MIPKNLGTKRTLGLKGSHLLAKLLLPPAAASSHNSQRPQNREALLAVSSVFSHFLSTWGSPAHCLERDSEWHHHRMAMGKPLASSYTRSATEGLQPAMPASHPHCAPEDLPDLPTMGKALSLAPSPSILPHPLLTWISWLEKGEVVAQHLTCSTATVSPPNLHQINCDPEKLGHMC